MCRGSDTKYLHRDECHKSFKYNTLKETSHGRQQCYQLEQDIYMYVFTCFEYFHFDEVAPVNWYKSSSEVRLSRRRKVDCR